jgi:hypothetical protein
MLFDEAFGRRAAQRGDEFDDARVLVAARQADDEIDVGAVLVLDRECVADRVELRVERVIGVDQRVAMSLRLDSGLVGFRSVISPAFWSSNSARPPLLGSFGIATVAPFGICAIDFHLRE